MENNQYRLHCRTLRVYGAQYSDDSSKLSVQDHSLHSNSYYSEHRRNQTLPIYVVSDCRPQFVTLFTKKLYCQLEIKIVLSTT